MVFGAGIKIHSNTHTLDTSATTGKLLSQIDIGSITERIRSSSLPGNKLGKKHEYEKNSQSDRGYRHTFVGI